MNHLRKIKAPERSKACRLFFLLTFAIIAPLFLSATTIGQDGTLFITKNDFRSECKSDSSITLGLTYPKPSRPDSIYFKDNQDGTRTDLTITLSPNRPFFGIEPRDCDQPLKFTNVRKVSINSLEFDSTFGFFPESSCNAAYCYVDISDNKIQVSLNPVLLNGDRFSTNAQLQNINNILLLPFDSGTTLKMDFAEMRTLRESNGMRFILIPPASISLNGFRLFEIPVGGPKIDVSAQGSTMKCTSTSCTSDKYPTKIMVQRYELPVVSAVKKDGFYLCGGNSDCILTQILYSNSQLSMTIGTKAIGPFNIPTLFLVPNQQVSRQEPVKKTASRPSTTRAPKARPD